MKIIRYAAIALLAFIYSEAQAAYDWTFNDAKIRHEGDRVEVSFTFDLSKLDVASSKALLLTPILIKANDSIAMPSVGIYGQRRYFHYLRRDGGIMLSDASETVFKDSEKPQEYAYSAILPWQSWMNGCQLYVKEVEYGCCHKELAKRCPEITRYMEAEPIRITPAYVRVQGNQRKDRAISGEANIQFVVDRTEIRPEMFNNPVELAKIESSIDSVRNDNDVTITRVWLKGFASPESPYSHNTDLARGRTKSVSEYVQNLYNFADGIIETDYEPEDWAGLRRYVNASNLDNRQAIIDIIDLQMDPDEKEAKIRKEFPNEYKFLKDFAYPALRHTEYRIEYTITDYTDIDQIRQVMSTAPGKLSQNEFYLLASSYEPGTPEFNNVFETCVAVYPDDETANLNAAIAALESNDYARAAKYLPKAGNSKEALYTRGMYDLSQGQYDKAEENLKAALKAGLEAAADGLKQLEKALEYQNFINNINN